MESGEVLALGNPAGVERPSTPLKARWRIVAADTCELCATRQKVKASAICFVLPSRLPLELGGEGSADKPIGSVYGISIYMYHKITPNAGKCSIHGAYGKLMVQ